MQISDEQVELAARKVATAHYAKRFDKPEDDPHVQMNVDANWHIFADDARIALSALSLPVQPVAWPEPKFVPMGGSGMRLNPERVAMLRREINAELVLGEQIQLFSALGLSDYIEPSTTPPVPPTKGPEDDLIAALQELLAEAEADDGRISREIFDRVSAFLALRSRPASALPVVEIDRFNGIIEHIENRCLAADGPVTPTMSEISDSELAEVWQLLQNIRSALIPSVQP